MSNGNNNNNNERPPSDGLLPIIYVALIIFLIYEFVLLGNATIESIGH